MSLYAFKAIFSDFSLRKSAIKNLQNSYSKEKEDKVRMEFAEAFVDWLYDYDNNRAPGVTCVTAIRDFLNSEMKTGLEGTNFNSKGCGANMRNPWFGLLPFSETEIAQLSVIQSSVTHYHPLALSSSALTALVIKGLISGDVVPGSGRVYEYTLTKVNELLASDLSVFPPAYYVGLKDLKTFLIKSKPNMEEFNSSKVTDDICSFLGEGKVAEEALLLAIAAVDSYEDNAIEGLRRLVLSSGDTDSIAAIAGAFFGAAYGVAIWPEDWFSKLETRYQSELDEAIVEMNHLTRAS